MARVRITRIEYLPGGAPGQPGMGMLGAGLRVVADGYQHTYSLDDARDIHRLERRLPWPPVVGGTDDPGLWKVYDDWVKAVVGWQDARYVPGSVDPAPYNALEEYDPATCWGGTRPDGWRDR